MFTGKSAVKDHKQHNFDLATNKLTSLNEIQRKSEALKVKVETILTKLQDSLTHLRGGGSTRSEVQSILNTVRAFETRVKVDNATIARKKSEAEAARNETITARTNAESDKALEKVDECLKVSQELLPVVEKAASNATKESAKADITLPDASVLAVKTAAHALYERYVPEYAPPMWSLEEVGEGDWMQRAAEVEVYCSEERAHEVNAIVKDREPVNMQMQRHYRNPIDSGYTAFYNNNYKTRLAPNFALYMKAKMSQSKTHLVNPMLVHVINTIGYAFDSRKQPDYQYFLTNFNDEKQTEFQDCLTETMSFIFACANRHGLKKICLCYFGGHFFAQGLTDLGHHYLTFFSEALRRVLQEYKGFTHVYLMGDNMEGLVHALHPVFQEHHIALSSAGRMPNVILTLGLDTLYVNSWDPHSVVGNGNNKDTTSLDGVFGIHSDMGYMSYTDINPNILTNLVKIPRVESRAHNVEELRRPREIQAETEARNRAARDAEKAAREAAAHEAAAREAAAHEAADKAAHAAADKAAREAAEKDAREAAEKLASDAAEKSAQKAAREAEKAAQKAAREAAAREAEKPVSPLRLRSRAVPREPEATRTASPRTARTKKKRMTADQRALEEGNAFLNRTKAN